MVNSIKEKCITGQTFFGTSAILGSVAATSIIANSGYDFIMIDLQHGFFDKESMTAAIHAMRLATPFVRVSDNNAGFINDALDMGAYGVVVPMINSREQAQMAVQFSKYPPLGSRSKGPAATAFYSSNYSDFANEQTLLTVMIETPEAVEKVDEILSVKGISLCLVGTSDLSFTLGCERDASIIIESFKKVVAAGNKYNIPIGAAVNSPAQVKDLVKLGVKFFLTPHDMSLLISGAKKSASEYGSVLGR